MRLNRNSLRSNVVLTVRVLGCLIAIAVTADHLRGDEPMLAVHAVPQTAPLWSQRFQCVEWTLMAQDEVTEDHAYALVSENRVCNCAGCLAFARQVATKVRPPEVFTVAHLLQRQEGPFGAATDEPSVSPDGSSVNEPPAVASGDEGTEPLQEETDAERCARVAAKIKMRSIRELTIDTTQPIERGGKGGAFPSNCATQIYGPYDTTPNSGAGTSHAWAETAASWTAPSFYHRPLYFDQPNLERYGHYLGNWQCQSVLSAADFFATIPTLPYRMVAEPPCDCVYTTGFGRPGNCNAHLCPCVPVSAKGLMVHYLGLTGLVFLAL